MIVINLIIGFTIPAIDNSAHISGLLAGAALAADRSVSEARYEPNPVDFTTAQVALLASSGSSFYSSGDSLQWPASLRCEILVADSRQFGGTGSSTQEFIDAVNDAQNAFEITRRVSSTRTNRHLAAVQADMTKAIDQLRNDPFTGPKPDELTSQTARL